MKNFCNSVNLKYNKLNILKAVVQTISIMNAKLNRDSRYFIDIKNNMAYARWPLRLAIASNNKLLLMIRGHLHEFVSEVLLGSL